MIRLISVLAAVSCFAPLAMSAQDDLYAESDGLSQVAYTNDRAIVQEVTPVGTFVGHDVEYVEARVLGTETRFGGLRFTRQNSPDLNPYGAAPAVGSVAKSQLGAAATQLRLILDEVIPRTPTKRTAWVYRGSEGFEVSGEYLTDRWRITLRLQDYGGGAAADMTVPDLERLVTLLSEAAAMR